MKKGILCLFMLFSIWNIVYAEEDSSLEVNANNVVLYNLNDDKVIFEKNSEERVSIASLTKIMTAIVAIENTDNLDEEVTITNEVFQGLEEYAMAGLRVGYQVSYRDLLYGVLLPSGADAVNAIVLNMGGSEKFVELMNNKAEELKLTNTHFDNAIGMDSKNNYSTAKDIATLLKYALQNDEFERIFTSREYIISKYNLKMESTLLKYANSTLDVSYIKGAKSGFTDDAGLCLASIANIDDIDYLLVNLGTNSKISKSGAVKDATSIYDYYSSNYSYQKVIYKNQVLKTIKNKYGYEKEYNIYATDDVELYLQNDINLKEITYIYEGVEEINSKYKKNDKLGIVTLSYKDEVLSTYNVYLNDELKYYHPFLYFSILIIIIILLLLGRIIQIKYRKKRRRKKRKKKK